MQPALKKSLTKRKKKKANADIKKDPGDINSITLPEFKESDMTKIVKFTLSKKIKGK